MTFSTILTKVNKVNVPFNERITLKHEDDDRVLPFVKFMHPNADIIEDLDKVYAYTPKGAYCYRSLGKYFERVNMETTKKDYYKIS